MFFWWSRRYRHNQPPTQATSRSPTLLGLKLLDVGSRILSKILFPPLIPGTVFQSAIFLAGVAGNMMVVVTVKGTKSLHTTTNCYLVSLAISDMITLLSSVPQVDMIWTLNKNILILNMNLILYDMHFLTCVQYLILYYYTLHLCT